MPLDRYTGTLMDLLEETESALAELYETYGKLVPDYSGFWNQLSREEAVHVKWMKKVREDLDSGLVEVNRRLLKIEEVQKLSQYVKKELNNPTTSPAEALRNASRIESSILENPFCTVFSSQDERSSNLLKALDEETRAHAAKVHQLIEKLGVPILTVKKTPVPGK